MDSPLAGHDLRKLSHVLVDFPLREIAPRLKGDGPEIESTLAVLERLKNANFEPEFFLHRLSLEIVAAVQRGDISRELALTVLYGKPNEEKRSLDKWSITLIFDVADLGRFPYRVADPAVASGWNRQLLGSDPESGAGGASFICALTGRPDSWLAEKMPNPTLRGLGPTYLMSMNTQTPCQTRYGQTSMSVFRVGKKTIQAIKDALEFILAEGRRGKTWATVPNGFRDKDDLMIAYLEEEPSLDVPVVAFFAETEPDADPALQVATYEARTSHIHEALRLHERPGRDLHIAVLALSQIDPGRKQVMFSGRYTVKAIYDGRDRWLAGARNVPDVTIPFPVKKGKSAVSRSGYQPNPSEVMDSFKCQWLRAGQESHGVPGVDIGRIYSVLLDPDARAESSWLLDRYLKLTESLLIGLGRALSSGLKSSKLSDSACREALTVIAVYGILLLRQGRNKETYMESRDYLLGQFLQMADLLHKKYCVHERDGSIPPQLIGNAAIPMALQSPRRALEVLCGRMPVYLAWADRYQGDEAGLVKWSRKELGRLSASLKEQELAPRVSTNGKAELLLGYLANVKQSERQENLV